MKKLTELEDHDKDAAIEPPRRKPFPQHAQEGEAAFVEMTRSCARELTVPPLDAAQEIRECHERVMASARKTVEDAVRIGEILTGVKVGLKHGEFQKWIARNCPFSERTARNYIRVYQRRDILKAANVAILTDAYGILARIRTKTANEASDALNEERSSEISERLRDEIRDTISECLNGAWQQLRVYPEIEWKHFCSGVRAWFQRE